MRLLKLHKDGGAFSLVSLEDSNVPPYAILSHTWGPDLEEVTFKDLIEGSGQNKAGYCKLEFCAKQAKEDGLRYFWIDTCCIDKSSSAELAEAINSMFKWYREAEHCYVYLSDVSSGESTTEEQSFVKSRWFTRGWTLQELLAPTSVRFFTAKGDPIGTRASLLQAIHKVTGISQSALQGQALEEHSIETRFSWADKRQTKREEDAAYSLVGIFDVSISPRYGEGRAKAMRRLRRELDETSRHPGFDPKPIQATQTAPAPALDNAKSEKGVPCTNLETPMQTQRMILDSLRYPRMEQRRLQVHDAHTGTYQWILEPEYCPESNPDSLIDWLCSDTVSRRIYWIHGKPGSGKSTMMRFLDRNIKTPKHTHPWTGEKSLLRVQYFFWDPGSELQKSIVGLLRTLLYQLLFQDPLLVSQIVINKEWVFTDSTSPNLVEWTQTELQETLFECIECVEERATVLLLLDGLDELNGTDDTREELIRFLNRIADLPHVKICLSSRPWNIFREAFQQCPNMRLENLTRDDISLYIETQLSSHARYRILAQHHQKSAEELTREISGRASGVFLWVRLVVRELLAGLRDGDSIERLHNRLHQVPSDLHDYFKRLMSSIQPSQRYEAAVFIQVALYEELDFTTLHPLRLVDLCFTDQERSDFVLSSRYPSPEISFAQRGHLIFRLDSTLRLLNSRCMGLLECYSGRQFESFDDGAEDISSSITVVSELPFDDNQSDGVNMRQDAKRRKGPLNTTADDWRVVDMLTVDFFHRTCRDFLLTPDAQRTLCEYTKGPYDAQMYLLNARIHEFLALTAMKDCTAQALSLASNIVSSLARPSYRNTTESLRLATTIKRSVETLIEGYRKGGFGLYIYPSVNSWKDEESSFLTLAIDFGITSYVKHNLTRQMVAAKRSRPILDYILHPRLINSRIQTGEIKIGNSTPDTELLSTILRLGANPNQIYGTASVWAHFLNTLADLIIDFPSDPFLPNYAVAVGLMIRAGAAPLIPYYWLTLNPERLQDYNLSTPTPVMSPDDRFSYRWPDAKPCRYQPADVGHGPWYAVADLLEHFRSHLGPDVDGLKALLNDASKTHESTVGV